LDGVTETKQILAGNPDIAYAMRGMVNADYHDPNRSETAPMNAESFYTHLYQGMTTRMTAPLSSMKIPNISIKKEIKISILVISSVKKKLPQWKTIKTIKRTKRIKMIEAAKETSPARKAIIRSN
jgi:hypothetical protein